MSGWQSVSCFFCPYKTHGNHIDYNLCVACICRLESSFKKTTAAFKLSTVEMTLAVLLEALRLDASQVGTGGCRQHFRSCIMGNTKSIYFNPYNT